MSETMPNAAQDPRGVYKLHYRMSMILRYEPSWFAEAMSALAMAGWSLIAFLSDAYNMEGWGYAMPVVGILLGPARLLYLAKTDAEPRVVAACMAFCWWLPLGLSLFDQRGLVPALALFSAMALGDLLTVAKFSLVALLERQLEKAVKAK